VRSRDGFSTERIPAVTQQERAAIEAVARRFSATWKSGRNAHLTVARKRVSVDVRTIRSRGAGRNGARPGLRFDRVATRLVDRVRAAVGEAIPDGSTVLLTVTAPIHLASKTASALEERIRTVIGRGSAGRDERRTIHRNRVRIRLLRHEIERAPKIIGFVHNPDSDPLLLLNITRDLLGLIETGSRSAQRAGRRWLVVVSQGRTADLQAYRYIYSQLCAAARFQKAFVVFPDGQVGVLMGHPPA
jgi:hypothetical protein